jgi:hypothetical protein
MAIQSVSIPGMYLGAASLICLLSYFGARNHRLGFQRLEREGNVTRLWLQWLTWNKSLAPENSAEAEKAPSEDTVLEPLVVKWHVTATGRQ